MRSRRRDRDPWAGRDDAPLGARTVRGEAIVTTRAVLGGLDPSRLGIDARAGTLAAIAGSAGNRAVAGLVSEVRADFPLDPPEGVRQVRAAARGGGPRRHAPPPTRPTRAVAGLVSAVRADFPLDPPEGVRQIRAVARGGGTLGHTRLSLDPTPPLFRLPAPTATDGGFAVKPGRTRAPELAFEVRWPMPGRHTLHEGRTAEGEVAHTYP